jgi:hypothetical protein
MYYTTETIIHDKIECWNKHGCASYSGKFSLSREASISSIISIHLHAYISVTPTGRIFMKFDTGVLYGNLSRNKITAKTGQITGYYVKTYVRLIVSDDINLP